MSISGGDFRSFGSIAATTSGNPFLMRIANALQDSGITRSAESRASATRILLHKGNTLYPLTAALAKLKSVYAQVVTTASPVHLITKRKHISAAAQVMKCRVDKTKR